jgi:hypothetical protein
LSSSILAEPKGPAGTRRITDERVRSLFVADGRQRTVPGVNHRIVVKRPKLRVNGTSKQFKITARVCDVGSAHGSCKERVTNKDMVGSVVHRQDQATTSQGVSGSVEHLQVNAPKTVGLPGFEGSIGFGWLGQRQSVPSSRLLGQRLEKRVVWMQVPINAVVGFESGDKAAVIEVCMGVHQGDDVA